MEQYNLPLPEERPERDENYAAFLDEFNASVAALNQKAQDIEDQSRQRGRRRSPPTTEQRREILASANSILRQIPLLDAGEEFVSVPQGTEPIAPRIGQFAVVGRAQSPLAPDTNGRDAEARANQHRSNRLGCAGLSELLTDLVPDAASLEVRPTTEREDERHQGFTPLLSEAMLSPGRLDLMTAIDAITTEESNEAFDSSQLRTDVLIAGGGVQGAILASTIRAIRPDLDITIADRNPRLGGQFRSYGYRPVFKLNSRTRRSARGSGLPGNEANLNRLGRRSVLQIDDFVFTTYPTNLDIGDAAAVNNYVASDRVLVDTTIQEPTTKRGKPLEAFRARHADGRELRIGAAITVFMPGFGDGPSRFGNGAGILTGTDLYRQFGDDTIARPMEPFNNSVVIVGGCGDTAKTNLELFSRLAPQDAYGRSTTGRDRGPRAILWVQDQVGVRSDYSSLARRRYQELASFIASGPGDRSLIVPCVGRIRSAANTGQTVTVATETGQEIPGNYFIDATGVAVQGIRRVAGFRLDGMEPLRVGEGAKSIGIRVPGRGIIVGGPGANLPLNDRLLPYAPSDIMNTVPENTAAIWSYEAATTALGTLIARQFA